MLRSLFAGVSGLRSHQVLMDVLGSNIANVNTVGYRSGRMTFQDQMSQTLSGAQGATAARGGVNPSQIGLGSQVGAIDTLFSQGNFQNTERLLDLGIEGKGFFQLVDQAGGIYFTRAGNFSLDADGYIVNPSNGLKLYGLLADRSGTLNDTQPAESIRIDYSMQADAQVSRNVTLGGNLDSRINPTTASSRNQLLGLFDEFGRSLNLHIGDVIEFSGGFVDKNGNGVLDGGDVDLSNIAIATVDANTTLADLAKAMEVALRAATGSTSIAVSVNPDGSIKVSTDSLNPIVNMSADVAGAPNSIFAGLFQDADGDQDMDVVASGSADTRTMRQADVTNSINVYDSQGNERTLTIAYARTTNHIPISSASLLTGLYSQSGVGLGLLAGDVVEFSAGTIGDFDLTTSGFTFTVTDSSTLSDLLSAIETALESVDTDSVTAGDQFANVSVSLNPDGTLSITSDTAITGLQMDTQVTTNPGLMTFFEDFGTSTLNGLDVGAGSTVTANGGMVSSLNTWNWRAIVPHPAQVFPTNDFGTVIFNSDGTFQNYGSGGLAAPVIKFDPDGTGSENDGVDELSITMDMSRLTQNASASTAAIRTQDGRGIGTLDSITIDPSGIITGVFTNGASMNLAKIQLAYIPNEGGLRRVGDTMFQESSNSGIPVLGNAGEGGRGTLSSGTLELSNVDLAQQFTNLIVAQRGFQANSRIITTSDEILTEVVNLKR